MRKRQDSSPDQAEKRAFSWARDFDNRDVKAPVLHLAICVLTVLAIVFLNAAVSCLPVSLTRYDTTLNSFHSISADTQDLLQNLDTPVNIYLVASTGKEDPTIVSLLKRYEAMSSQIHVTYVDPAYAPGFVGQYTSDTVFADNGMIVEGSARSHVIRYSDYYSYTAFLGEDYLNHAIQYVSSNLVSTLYTLTGHGEIELSSAMVETMVSDGYGVSALNLRSAPQVPEDAAGVLLCSPTEDLSNGELQELLRYLQQGGRLLLLTDYGTGDMPNLSYLLRSYGAQQAQGYICEGDSGIFLTGMPSYVAPTPQFYEASSAIIDGVAAVLMPMSQGIVETPDCRASVRIYPLLRTSDSAYSKVNPSSTSGGKEFGDLDGPFTVGAAIMEKVAGGETRIVWYTTSQFLDHNIDELVSGSNLMLFYNSVSWLCNDGNVPSIHSKPLSLDTLTVPGPEARLIAGVLIFGAPLAVLLAGGIVCVRRRRR